MVLSDGDIASIECAVGKGHGKYDNLRMLILTPLSRNFAQAFIIDAEALLGFVLQMTPVQTLWINMVTAVTPRIAFAWEKAEGDLMTRAGPTDEVLMIATAAIIGLQLLLTYAHFMNTLLVTMRMDVRAGFSSSMWALLCLEGWKVKRCCSVATTFPSPLIRRPRCGRGGKAKCPRTGDLWQTGRQGRDLNWTRACALGRCLQCAASQIVRSRGLTKRRKGDSHA